MQNKLWGKELIKIWKAQGWIEIWVHYGFWFRTRGSESVHHLKPVLGIRAFWCGSGPLTNGSGPLTNRSGSERPKKCGSCGSGSPTLFKVLDFNTDVMHGIIGKSITLTFTKGKSTSAQPNQTKPVVHIPSEPDIPTIYHHHVFPIARRTTIRWRHMPGAAGRGGGGRVHGVAVVQPTIPWPPQHHLIKYGKNYLS